MSVVDIIKVTIFALGVILIVHLLFNILLNQNKTNGKEKYTNSSTRSSSKKKVTFIDYTDHETVVTPSNTDSVDLADIKNELKDWMENQQPCDNTRDTELDRVFRDSQVDIKNMIDEVPKPIEKPDFDFSAENVKNHPKFPQMAEEPMAWNSAFENVIGQSGSSDDLSAWDSGNFGFAPLT